MPASFSTSRLSASSTAASSSPSPTSAAARTRAIAGTRDGKREKKPNTFTDFIAAGEFLVEGGLHPARPHRRQRRLGRRHADGRGRQHGARPVPRHHRRRAVRRRAQHHAGREPAADAAGVAGVGQPDQVQGGFRDHPLLLALRQRGRQGLSAHLRLRRAHRPARHLLGAGQVDRAAAPPQHRPAT